MLPGSRALTLEEEAAMLARYSSHQVWEYLDQVSRSPKRGPDDAQALRDLLSKLKAKTS